MWHQNIWVKKLYPQDGVWIKQRKAICGQQCSHDPAPQEPDTSLALEQVAGLKMPHKLSHVSGLPSKKT